MSDAKSAFGTTLKKSAVAIAELTSIGGPSLSADTLDVSTHDSASGYREFVQGMRDGGEISIEGNFIPGNAGQIALKTDFDDGSSDEYVITFPASMATTWTFNAIITGFETSAPFDDKASFTATMKVTGKPTLAVTASAGLTTPWFSVSESGVIVPAPSNDDYTYVVTFLTGVTSFTVTPTAAAGTIKVNGNTVVSGEASSAIALGAAETVTVVTITVEETNKTRVTYTLYCAREAAP